MSLKHFEIYWDQARKRLCMNHVAGRNGRGKEHIQALFSSSQRLGCLCWTLHQGQRSSSGQQPPLWQSVIQAGSEKWFCSSSTERVSPCSVYPSDWIGAFGWAEETTDNPSLWQPGAIHHLLWLQCWGEAVACSEWSRDEQPLGDVLGALKYLREATRQDGDTLVSICDSSWTFTFWHPGCHILLAKVSVCLGQRDAVGREAESSIPPRGAGRACMKNDHPSPPSWFYDLSLQKLWNKPAQQQGKCLSSLSKTLLPLLLCGLGRLSLLYSCRHHCY